MDLTFKIIWFEDVDEWYNTTSRRVQRYIENKNYKVNIQRIKKASDYKLNKLELYNCDLLIIDYELEKVYDQNGEKNIYGSDIIQMIRDGNFFNDILFYSSHGYDVINDIMKQKGLLPYLYFKFACLSNIINVDLDFKYPIISATAYFGGISNNMCI